MRSLAYARLVSISTTSRYFAAVPAWLVSTVRTSKRLFGVRASASAIIPLTRDHRIQILVSDLVSAFALGACMLASTIPRLHPLPTIALGVGQGNILPETDPLWRRMIRWLTDSCFGRSKKPPAQSASPPLRWLRAHHDLVLPLYSAQHASETRMCQRLG
jgi:hypothetical protein